MSTSKNERQPVGQKTMNGWASLIQRCEGLWPRWCDTARMHIIDMMKG
jgi:hypothetical protein